MQLLHGLPVHPPSIVHAQHGNPLCSSIIAFAMADVPLGAYDPILACLPPHNPKRAHSTSETFIVLRSITRAVWWCKVRGAA